MDTALERFIATWKPLAEAVIDPWFIVDRDRAIVEHNRAFYSLLPRPVARGLKGKKCHEVLELDICKDRCIAEQCWREKRQVRLNEITGRPAQGERDLRFVLSALPIFDEAGNQVGALEIQRNVTDEAMVQTRYQEMLDHEARERQRLQAQVRSRTKELLETSQALLRVQRELLAHKRGMAP
jgi:hypothetical protein